MFFFCERRERSRLNIYTRDEKNWLRLHLEFFSEAKLFFLIFSEYELAAWLSMSGEFKFSYSYYFLHSLNFFLMPNKKLVIKPNKINLI